MFKILSGTKTGGVWYLQTPTYKSVSEAKQAAAKQAADYNDGKVFMVIRVEETLRVKISVELENV